MDHREQIIERWGEWLPPEPHRQAVVDFVARGRASIARPDEDQPPVLLYEDGGAMSLPLVRYDGSGPFYSAERPQTESGERRTTKYSDVCGSVDEFKRIVQQGPEALERKSDEIAELFDDIRYMIGRMYRRQREYIAFADQLREALDRLESLEIVDRAPSEEGLTEIESMLRSGRADDAGRLNELAEQVRAVAQAQEDNLREQKAAAIDVLAAYRRVRGGRDWTEAEAAIEDED